MTANLIPLICILTLITGCAPLTPHDHIKASEPYKSIPPHTPLILTHMIGNDALVIRSEPKFAGAISSLTFRGQEYVNNTDHGRLMQGAIAYDGLLECLNPTQAGGSRDNGNVGQRSTSQRLSGYVTPENALHVSTRMAFWMRPGMKCTDQGGTRVPVHNTKRLSDDIYTIEHRFGLNGHPNVARLDISYAIAGSYQTAVVEALTIYTPLAFDTFHSINLETGAMTLEPTLTSDETPAPLILSTTDGTHAIAFVSQQPGATYARFRFSDTNKISLVYRDRDGITGLNQYKAAWVIGTRDEVATRVRELIRPQ
jgi:hypothetical protein